MDISALEKIKALGEREVSGGWIAGGTAAVVKDGRQIWSCGFGYADIAAKTPMNEKSIVRLFSLSKPVTACAVLRLIERGELDLFSSVWWYLSGFRDAMVAVDGKLVPAEREITIKDLLTMTSGILYPEGGYAGEQMGALFDENIKEKDLGIQMSTVDLANEIGKRPLGHQPGEVWHYGLSADVLGAVVEQVSGMKYSEFLRKEIFEPLGMEDTGFYIPKNKLDRAAKVYDDRGSGLEEFTECFLGLPDPAKCENPMFESGGAGIVSTISDYGKFAGALARGGTSADGYRLLSEKAVRFMSQPALREDQRAGYAGWQSMPGYSYGCLVRVLDRPEEAMHFGSVGEFGWDGWAGTYVCCDPAENTVSLLFIQRTNAGTNQFTRKVKNVICSAM